MLLAKPWAGCRKSVCTVSLRATAQEFLPCELLIPDLTQMLRPHLVKELLAKRSVCLAVVSGPGLRQEAAPGFVGERDHS